MPSYRIILTLLLVAFATQFASAQTPAPVIFVANSGEFGNPNNNSHVTIFDGYVGSSYTTDTIGSSSVQDIKVELPNLASSNSPFGGFVYVAAQDRIVKYDAFGQRVATGMFGAPSTIHLDIYDDYLLAGNWYGLSNYNLRIFDKNTLAIVDSVQGILQGAKDFLVVGDTAYVTQNFTTSAFTDSAGFLAVVDLTTFTHVRDIHFSNNGEDLGRLVLKGDKIYGINPASNTISWYDIQTGKDSTMATGVNIGVRGNGQQVQLAFAGQAYFVYDDKLGTWDLENNIPVSPAIIDSQVTAFVRDEIGVGNDLYFIQTDFFSYHRGFRFGGQTQFPVGFSPEAMGIAYYGFIGIEKNISLPISLFPNPATDYIQIDLPELSDPELEISIFNIMGQKIAEQTSSNEDEIKLKIEYLSPGVYFLEVKGIQKRYSGRFIKE